MVTTAINSANCAVQSNFSAESVPPYAKTSVNSAPPYAKGTSFNGKKDENKEAIQRVQAEFVNQVMKGYNKREAFLNALSVIEKKENEYGDFYERMSAIKMPDLSGITPESIKPWMELIQFAIPIIKSILDLLPKPKQEEHPEPANI